MRYKNRIVLTNSRGVSHTLRSFESVSITENENNPLKTCSVSAGFFDNREIMKNFSIGSTIEIYSRREDESKEKRLFKGVINTVPRTLDTNLKSYKFDATCLLGKTQKIMINEFFEDQSLSHIVRYLMESYTNFFERFQISVPNNTRVTMEFRDEFLFDALSKIAEATGGRFEADDTTFIFDKGDPVINEKELKRGMFHKGSASFTDSSDQMVNFMRAYGSKELTPEFREEIFIGNGTSTVFTTTYQPSNSTVFLDDVTQSLGIKSMHNSGYQVYMDYNSSTFEFVKAPPSGQTVRIRYKYYQRIVVEESDQNSIEEFGMFGASERYDHISDREFLREVIREKIRRYNRPIKTGSIEPFYDHWNVGEMIYVNIPDIDVQEHLICTGKGTNIKPGIVSYNLTFEEQPNLTDILKNHLERIRELEKSNDEIEYIDKYRSVTETIELNETVDMKLIDWESTFRVGISAIGDVI